MVVAGATAGVAVSPLAGSPDLSLAPALVIVALALAALRPRPATSAWLCLVALTAACAGLAEGSWRLAAMERGALTAPAGARIAVSGHVAAVPRRSRGITRLQATTPHGRLLIEVQGPVPDVGVGAELRASGTVRAAPPWYAGYLRRHGIHQILATRRIELTGRRRGGLASIIDGVRIRSERALGRGVPRDEAALARGFVLGQDDRIDPDTVEDFKRSGLAHLLAVSGENVLLLALLAMPLLGLAGLGLRARLACVLVLIALYVPVTGAGPSIQRAGVMGAAGVVAALAGRPRSRGYAVLLAALVTLAINPLSSGDPGWQLSFAAVLGIAFWARPIREALDRPAGRDRPASGLRRALLDGAAVTIAATIVTAPLMAHHFEAVSPASLPANLLALPAVAPAMWLGMLSAIAGQVPGLPVEPFNWLDSLLVAYIAQVANWCAAPDWALIPVGLRGWPAVAVAYVLIGAALWTSGAWVRRRKLLAASSRRPRRGQRSRVALAALSFALVLAWVAVPGTSSGGGARPGLRIEFLDVGQGDAILLQPADGGAVLVDGGPPGAGLAEKLEDAGVAGLAAVAVTHDQSDHAGGIEEVLGRLPVRTLLYGEPSSRLLAAAASAGVRAVHVAEGGEVRSGSLRLAVLWPPRSEPAASGAADDPNLGALVLLARWHGFSALLTADAEAEAAPIDPGPVDVLKVAHHGSADAGLDGLLGRTMPRLAVISVGEENTYGHPTGETLTTLGRHRVPTMRTDEKGTIRVDVNVKGWTVGGRD